jgi:uncharacterized membrane protein
MDKLNKGFLKLINKKYIILAVLLILAVSTRFINIGTQSILIDETWVVPSTFAHFDKEDIFPKLFTYPQFYSLSEKKQQVIRNLYTLHPLFQVAALHMASDLHPPLFFFANYYWSKRFGFSESAIRTPAAIFAILTFFLLFLVLYRQGVEFPKRVIILSFIILSPIFLFFSNFARPYTLLVLLSLLSSYLAYEMVCTDFKRNIVFWYVISAVSVLCTHYYSVLVVASQGLYLIIERLIFEKRKDLLKILSIGAIVGILFSPIFLTFLFKLWHNSTSSGDISFKFFTLDSLKDLALSFGFAYSKSTLNSYLNVIITLLQVTLFICGIIFLWKRKGERTARFWLFYFFSPFILIVILNLWKPIFTVRNSLILLVPYMTICGFGLFMIRNLIWKTVIYIPMAVVGLVFVYYGASWGNVKGPGALEDWRSTSNYIKALNEQLPVYVYNPSYRDALYYYIPDADKIRGFPEELRKEGPLSKVFILVIMKPEGYSYKLEQKITEELPFLNKNNLFDVKYLREFPYIYLFKVERIENKT